MKSNFYVVQIHCGKGIWEDLVENDSELMEFTDYESAFDYLCQEQKFWGALQRYRIMKDGELIKQFEPHHEWEEDK